MSALQKGEQLTKALLIMCQAHAGQYDKGGKPYALHPLTVLHKLGTDDEDVQCAAVLHDVIEDCSGKVIFVDGKEQEVSFSMLASAGISERTIAAVRALTKMPGQSYAEYQAAVLSNRDAMLVKKEDLRTNSDLRRLKSKKISDKDIARVAKYMAFYATIEQTLEALSTQ